MGNKRRLGFRIFQRIAARDCVIGITRVTFDHGPPFGCLDFIHLLKSCEVSFSWRGSGYFAGDKGTSKSTLEFFAELVCTRANEGCNYLSGGRIIPALKRRRRNSGRRKKSKSDSFMISMGSISPCDKGTGSWDFAYA
jgi:hypothetical protein